MLLSYSSHQPQPEWMLILVQSCHYLSVWGQQGQFNAIISAANVHFSSWVGKERVWGWGTERITDLTFSLVPSFKFLYYLCPWMSFSILPSCFLCLPAHPPGQLCASPVLASILFSRLSSALLWEYSLVLLPLFSFSLCSCLVPFC